KIDTRLVGIWEGKEDNQQVDGASKSWVMTRNEDGTFIIEFKATINGRVRSSTEKGKWWIENELFYEYHNNSGKTDIYKYQVLNKNQIKFSSTYLAVNFNSPSYEFIDNRQKK